MRNKIYHIFYGIMIATFIVVLVQLSFCYEGTSIIDECFEEPKEFLTGWIMENGTEVDPSELGSLEELRINDPFSIYHRIPEYLAEGQYLCFRSKNVFFQVYMNGELVYDPYVPQHDLYTKSFGTHWNYVPISAEHKGKEIEIKITKVYESARACVDNIYIGQPGRVIMETVEEKLVAFITCILLLFVGGLLIIVDIPINMRTQKNHELLYLGLFSVSVATWCLAETHLLQYYIGDSRLMQIVSCYSLMLVAIPLVLDLDAAFGFKSRIVVPIMAGGSFASFLVIWCMHLTNIADIHETLHITHVVLVASAVTLFYTIVRNTFVTGKSAGKNIYRILRGIGLSGLSIATLIDIWRYYTDTGNDTAMFVRIGLLIFIICFGSSSLEKTINAVKLGVQTEFVSQLAYKDGLTGIGNRTAFEESLIELERIKNTLHSVGIIMFDVNDLKYVNDNMGHRVGDALITECAKLLQEAFLPVDGECFRIGGDEFVVILSGDRVRNRFETGIHSFEESMRIHNERKDKVFRISVAYGFAAYDESYDGIMLMNIYQQADVLMYEMKKRIKANQVPPAEYYRTRN